MTSQPPWEEVKKNILQKEFCKLLQKEVIVQTQADYAGYNYISPIFTTFIALYT